ncbi:MAG TPA: DUF4915 domain-containing protein [Gaiellaceae bacterium]|nr:DUF4915 domain-containing protein [Gaiellaceae bacterium]
MEIAVSCLDEGLLLLDGGRVEQIDRLPTTGLAWSGSRIARARFDPGETARTGEILLYGSGGLDRRLSVPGLADPHDLAWDGELLVAVSTLGNAVFWIDAAGRPVRRWEPSGTGDCRHLNGVAVYAGRVLVTAFGPFARHREWAELTRDGRGVLLDAASDSVVAAGFSSPHSPRVVEGRLLICDSGRSDLVVLAPSGLVERRLRLSGWTRGIAVGGEHIYVGESVRRGKSGSATVAVLTRERLALVDRVELPVREVYDLLALPKSATRALATPSPPMLPMDALASRDLHVSIHLDELRPLRRGEPADIHCRVTNLGRVPLATAPPHPVSIAAGWEGPARCLWSPLPGAIQAGETAGCTARLLAPDRPGRHELHLAVVQEGVAWLSGGVVAKVEVS